MKKPSAPTAKQKTNSKSHLPPAYSEVLKGIGSFIQYWGFKDVHGQVWGCIFMAKEPVDANHIIQHLQLSKAAVSLAIKDLLEYRVILELEKTKPSTRKFVSNPDLVEVICNVLRFREKHMLSVIAAASKSLLQATPEEYERAHISKEKVENLKEMTEGAQFVLEQMLRHQNIDLGHLFALLDTRP